MERKKPPPDSWFRTFSPENPAVVLTDEFLNIASGEVGRRMNQWRKNDFILSTNISLDHKNQTMITEEMHEAETLILKVTLFKPQEIWDRMVAIYQKKTKNSPTAIQSKPSVDF